MVARLLTVGLTLGLSGLASVAVSPLSAAQAAYPAWSGNVAQPKRPYFRPWNKAERRSANGRWRPQSAPLGRASSHPRQRLAANRVSRRRPPQPVFQLQQRTPERKATATGRGVQIGVRFRPDRRSPPVVPAVPVDRQARSQYPAELHARFRPMQPRRRASYEDRQRQQYRSGFARPVVARSDRYGHRPVWR